MAYYLPHHLFVVHSSFNKYLLVTYNTPGIVLGTDREAIQEDNNLCSCEAYILVWQINNIKNLILKVTRALEKTNRVRRMGFWGRDKLWNCKQDPQLAPQCEKGRKQEAERARHVNMKRRAFQEKGMAVRGPWGSIASTELEGKQGGQYSWHGVMERKSSKRRTQLLTL